MPSWVPQEFSEISAKGLDFTARSRSPPSFEARLRPGWAHHVPEPHISGRSAAPGIATDPHGSPRSSPTRSARDRPVEQRAGQSSRLGPQTVSPQTQRRSLQVRRLGSGARAALAPSAAQLATLRPRAASRFRPDAGVAAPRNAHGSPASPQVRGVASRGSASSQAGVLAARNTTIGRYGCMIGPIASAAWEAISCARRGPMRSSQPVNRGWPKR